MPDRSRLVIAPGGDRLHVVEHQHPRHKAQRTEAIHQAAEQRLLAHIGRETHPYPAAVLQPTRQEVAPARRLVREREVANLAPIHLQILARQALKANRHVGDGLLMQQTQPLVAHGRPPHRTAAAVRMLRVLARQLHHPYAAESLLQPLNDLPAERIDARLPSPRGRLPIDGLAQCAGDRVLTAPQLAGNLAQALAALMQQMDSTAFHAS